MRVKHHFARRRLLRLVGRETVDRHVAEVQVLVTGVGNRCERDRIGRADGTRRSPDCSAVRVVGAARRGRDCRDELCTANAAAGRKIAHWIGFGDTQGPNRRNRKPVIAADIGRRRGIYQPGTVGQLHRHALDALSQVGRLLRIGRCLGPLKNPIIGSGAGPAGIAEYLAGNQGAGAQADVPVRRCNQADAHRGVTAAGRRPEEPRRRCNCHRVNRTVGHDNLVIAGVHVVECEVTASRCQRDRLHHQPAGTHEIHKDIDASCPSLARRAEVKHAVVVRIHIHLAGHRHTGAVHDQVSHVRLRTCGRRLRGRHP